MIDQRTRAGDPSQVALLFLEKLEQLDIEGLMSLLVDDAVQEMPFDRNEATRVIAGKASLRVRYTTLFELFESCSFTVDAIHGHADPEWVTLEYHGHIVADDGVAFANTYLGMFRVKDGLIHQFREFFAPVIPEERLEPAMPESK